MIKKVYISKYRQALRENADLRFIIKDINLHFKEETYGLDYNFYLRLGKCTPVVFNTFLYENGFKIVLEGHVLLIYKKEKNEK